jgi:hypothetical protein
LELVGYAKIMGRERKLGRALEKKLKGKREMGPPKTGYWKTSRSEERAVKKLKRKDFGKREQTGYFSSYNPYKMEIMQEEKEGEGRRRVKEEEKEEEMTIQW